MKINTQKIISRGTLWRDSLENDLILKNLVIAKKKTSAGIQKYFIPLYLDFPFTTFYWYRINSLFKTRLDILWFSTWTFQNDHKIRIIDSNFYYCVNFNSTF